MWAGAQLGGDSDGAEVIQPSQFGTAQHESRTHRKGDEEDQAYRCQAVVGDGFSLSGNTASSRAGTADVQEAVLEGPVPAEVRLGVVLVFPPLAHVELTQFQLRLA